MSDWRMKCNRCGTSEGELRRCTRCFTVYYCSKNCQRIDWASHKKQCVMKLDTQSVGNGINRKATKDSPENKNESETKYVKETDAKLLGSAPPSKNDTYITGAENADRNSNVNVKRSSASSQDAERHPQSSKANTGSSSTDNASERSTNKTTFPFRIEKGTCRCCSKLFCTMKCANCKAMFYCSKECQRSDWPAHKKHCKKVGDEGLPRKSTPLTDDEAFIVDNMKRRQQSFNEGMFGRKSDEKNTFEINIPNFAGPLERLLASATPDMLKIYERPPGSLPKALRYARACFPGWTVIDDFHDIPQEVSRMEMFQEMQKQSMRNVLVAFMFMYHDHVMRHGVFLKDSSDNITHVEFYFDHIGDNPWPHFTYADVRPGNYILIQNPLIHQFMDGQVGLRINDPAEVKICITEGLF